MSAGNIVQKITLLTLVEHHIPRLGKKYLLIGKAFGSTALGILGMLEDKLNFIAPFVILNFRTGVLGHFNSPPVGTHLILLFNLAAHLLYIKALALVADNKGRGVTAALPLKMHPLSGNFRIRTALKNNIHHAFAL